MNFSESQKKKRESMIKKGKTMYEIAESIGGGCTWTDIQGYCWQSGTMSWQGSKKIISNALKKLPSAGTAVERTKLVEKIDTQVRYLYYLGKEMRDRIAEVEKALEKIRI